jgi:hypothetical protein
VAIVIQEAIHYVNTTPLPGDDESQQGDVEHEQVPF